MPESSADTNSDSASQANTEPVSEPESTSAAESETAPPETEVASDEAQGPAAEPVPVMPPPSAIVQPFDAAGAPPSWGQPVRKSHAKVIILVVVLALLALAAAGWFAYQNGALKFLGLSSQPAPTAQPQASTSPTANLDAALQEADTTLGDASTSLLNADTALADKQGDISE